MQITSTKKKVDVICVNIYIYIIIIKRIIIFGLYHTNTKWYQLILDLCTTRFYPNVYLQRNTFYSNKHIFVTSKRHCMI